MINKRGFKNRLYKYCSSETNLRYAQTQQDRLFYSMCMLKRFAKKLSCKTHIAVLDIGPFVPFASVYRRVLAETTEAKIELKCLELPEAKHESYKIINDIQCYFCNVETELFPFEDDSFDIILFLEVLEHLIVSPFHVLQEVNRVIRKDGFLLLSTPNVASLANRFKITLGRNIYDSYSSEGTYGRHQREYTMREVGSLLEAAGFTKILSHSELGRLGQGNWRESYITAAKKMLLVRIEHLLRVVLKLNTGKIIFYVGRKANKVNSPPPWLFRESPGLQSLFKQGVPTNGK